MINDKSRVRQAIDRGWPDQQRFLKSLINERSLRGNTNGAMDQAAQLLDELGLRHQRIGIDVESLSKQRAFSPADWPYEGLYNLVGKLPGTGGGRSLVMNGHLDVVPTAPDEHWTRDPWGGEVDQGRMYGRGAADMKAGVSAMLFAIRALREAGVRLAGDILVHLVFDEECTGNGTLACLASGAIGDACIIPEPFGLASVSAQPGVLWAQVKVRGRAAHAALASSAVNSIEKMIVVLNALRQLEGELNRAPSHPSFTNVSHPLNFNFGQLHGGDWTSSVPELCTMDVRFACYPGEDLNEVQQHFVDRIAAAAESDEWLCKNPPTVQFYGFRADGVVYDTESAISRSVNLNHESVLGVPCRRVPITATTDNRFFDNEFGIPSVCYGPIGGQLHAPDEWVDLQSVRQCTEVIAATMLDWCGGR
jgi:acetylornithine deacetylase